MNDEEVINRLKQYKENLARMKLLSSYSVGYGISISRLNEDDHLQELHQKLRSMPSYMYLNSKEQELELTASAYLTKYPAGIKSQQRAIPVSGADEEDEQLLRTLRMKIQKIIEARTGQIKDMDIVLERLSEWQDLRHEIKEIDDALDALEIYQAHYAELIKLRYLEKKSLSETAEIMGVTGRTIGRWNTSAIREIKKLLKLSA